MGFYIFQKDLQSTTDNERKSHDHSSVLVLGEVKGVMIMKVALHRCITSSTPFICVS